MRAGLMLLLVACGSPEHAAGKGGSADPGDDTSAPSPECPSPGFAAEPVDWPLPALGVFDHQFDVRPDDGVSWTLLDLDGDDRRDLVVTELPDGDATLGRTTWAVFGNTGAGFASQATSWSLPADYPDGTFARTSDTTEGDGVTWTLFELTGDRALDLVVSRDPADPLVGTATWRVFENRGDGFASAPLSWTLPPGFADGTFHRLADVQDDGETWTVLDLDGDGRADIVQSGASDGSLGDTSWRWFANDGGGFSAAADWALPSGLPAGALSTWADTDPADGLSWARLDLDGDTVGDLVVSQRADDLSVGEQRWDVYPSEAAGFAAEPVAWTLPGGFPAGTFREAYDADGPADGLRWVLADLDGTRGPEVVWTDDAAATDPGVDTWAWFDNTGSGFADAASPWSLPSGFDAGVFAAWTDDSPDDALGWFLVDLDGDDRMDIVVTRRPDAAAVGVDRWHVYRGVCE